MAKGQITIHQSHLPRHFFVGVPVGLAGSSYEKAMEMAYIVLTKSRTGYWRLKDLYRMAAGIENRGHDLAFAHQ